MPNYSYDLPPHPVSYAMVDVAELELDPSYQREVDRARVKRWAAKAEPAAIGTLVLSRRRKGTKDRLFIVDGAHRHALCQLMGTERVHAEIHDDLSVEQEAALFLLLNRERQVQTKLQQYKAGVTSGIEPFVSLAKVLASHDLKLAPSTSTNAIRAVATLESIVVVYGPDVLDRTLTVAQMAWGREATTWDGNVLGGMAKFLGKHGEDVSNEELAKRLGFTDASVFSRKVMAKATLGGQVGGNGGARQAAYLLIKDAWNKHRPSNRRIK